MKNSSTPDLENKNNRADEAALEALLREAKKGPGEASLEALLENIKKGPEDAGLKDAKESSGKVPSEALFADSEKQIPEENSAKKDKQYLATEGVSTKAIEDAHVNAPQKSERTAKKAADHKTQILIVHADTTQLSVLEMSFISEGYDVVIFQTGKEALNFLKKNVPDIMLLDADMEKLTGMDICFRIRKIERFATVPVIIMTESVDDRTETMVKMCYANDFFPKAHKNIELKAKVRKLIDKSDVEKLT